MIMKTNHQLIKLKGLQSVAAVILLLVVILYALGLIGGAQKIAPGTTPKPARALPLGAQLVQAVKQTSDAKQTWPGVVQSRTLTKIAPKMTARILSVKVNSGDRVKKGAVIAQLDEREINARLNEANAALNAALADAAQAQADARRSRDLYAKEATTRASHDAVMARAKTAQAGVAQALSRMEEIRVSGGENTLYAPFDGIIAERLKEPGDMGMPGDPIVILFKSDDLRLEAGIPSDCIKYIKPGLLVKVRIDALDKSLSAKVDEIMPGADPQTGMQIVKAALPLTAGLEPGQFAWLEQSCAVQQAELMIPVRAVLRFGQLEAVKVVQGEEVYTRHIRTGKQQGDRVAVLSGLREGETIISNSEITLPEAR